MSSCIINLRRNLGLMYIIPGSNLRGAEFITNSAVGKKI